MSGTGPVGGLGRSEDVSLRMEAAVECSKERREEGWGQISASLLYDGYWSLVWGRGNDC